MFECYGHGTGRRGKPGRASTLVLGLLLAGDFASAGAVEVGDTEVDLSVEDGRLSMTLEQAVPLGELIEALGAEAGFAVRITGDLGPVQPRTIEGRPLDEAIRALAGDHSLLMVFEESAGQERLARIVIYPARPPAERARARAQARARQSAPASERAAPLADDLAERIRELDAEGLSHQEISSRVGAPVERIQRYLQTLERQN